MFHVDHSRRPHDGEIPRATALDRSSHIGALDSRARAVPATSDYAHNGGA